MWQRGLGGRRHRKQFEPGVFCPFDSSYVIPAKAGKQAAGGAFRGTAIQCLFKLDIRSTIGRPAMSKSKGGYDENRSATRTHRSTNHGGMGAPWGVRVVGRCLCHRLFSSSFFEI
jgi:hypothetical protein